MRLWGQLFIGCRFSNWYGSINVFLPVSGRWHNAAKFLRNPVVNICIFAILNRIWMFYRYCMTFKIYKTWLEILVAINSDNWRNCCISLKLYFRPIQFMFLLYDVDRTYRDLRAHFSKHIVVYSVFELCMSNYLLSCWPEHSFYIVFFYLCN